MIGNDTFNHDLDALGYLLRDRFRDADPFPHIVINDFLRPDVLEAALAAYPKTTDNIPWREYTGKHESLKFACSEVSALPVTCQRVLQALNGKPMVDFLRMITGIEDLREDNKYVGGGLHQIRRTGLLDVHVDFNKLDDNNWRRVNALLFVNKDWPEEYGGHTELWRSKTESAVKALPIFNRLVVFNTTDTSWHGHPHPLTCPDDRTRKSFATYYYSDNPPPDASQPFRDTTWAKS
jgi:hypothetical protein